jgi:uncharacterized protein (TIGR02453 family)
VSRALFPGFSPEAVSFLRELEANNDREWFRAHKAEWQRNLDEPIRALGEALSKFGAPKTFRPYNDTRFHARPPIKEQVGLALGTGGGAGSYVELSLDGVLVAAGLYDPRPDQVARLRAAIEDGRGAAGLTRALTTAERAGLQLGEPELKRAPRGVDPAHPRIDLLRRRRMVVHRRDPLGDWVHTEAFEQRVRALLEAAAPLVRWLGEHVGPSTTGQAPRR